MPKEWDQPRKANQTMPISKRYGIKTSILWLPRGMRLEFWKNPTHQPAVIKGEFSSVMHEGHIPVVPKGFRFRCPVRHKKRNECAQTSGGRRTLDWITDPQVMPLFA